MNDKDLMKQNLLVLKSKLNNVRRVIKQNDDILTNEKKFIDGHLYLLGDYCFHHICKSSFSCMFVYRIIEDIENHQKKYDIYRDRNASYREIESIVIENIRYICKKLCIENV